MKDSRSPFASLLLALSSAILLLISFPSFNQPWCAWVALVPWLVALRGLTPRRAFLQSSLVGLIFFLGSLWWMVHLTAFGGWVAILGWLVLCAYLALYFGLFGYLVRSVCLLPSAFCLLIIPSIWVALEFARSHLLSGLGWNLLGYSQTPSLTAIQIADVTGVWGVSWLVVAVNVALAHVVLEHDRRRSLTAALIAAALVVGSWSYGERRLRELRTTDAASIAVVQGNIPQDEKWDERFQARILQQYERLTRDAAAHRLDLIIWPETAVPGVVGVDAHVTAWLQRLAADAQTPMLVGAPMVRPESRGLLRLTNSAVLLDVAGTPTARYDKLHLVPFGEFVPFESIAPWLRDVLPPIGEFVPGKEHTVFELPVQGSRFTVQGSPLKFGVLICFEDTFPELARAMVSRGARMLVTITNDAWFGPTAAAYQHAQASTLRAVELRVPMVRAANTGWSGCIDAAGRWIASVHVTDGHDRAGSVIAGEEVSPVAGPATELFVEGVATCQVGTTDTTTLYRRWGDWLPWFCILLVIGWLALSFSARRAR